MIHHPKLRSMAHSPSFDFFTAFKGINIYVFIQVREESQEQHGPGVLESTIKPITILMTIDVIHEPSQ